MKFLVDERLHTYRRAGRGVQHPAEFREMQGIRYAYDKETSSMAVKTPSKAIAALAALKALQEDAKRKGLDKLTMDEINAEIAAHRREKRAKLKGPKSR